MLLAWGRSHRTTPDGELIRWGTDLARVEGTVGQRRHRGGDRPRRGARAAAGRKRIRVNGLGRRATGLAGLLRVVLFAPEEMLLVAGSPSLRRAALDQLAVGRLAGLRRRARDVRPDAPAAQQPAAGDPRGGRVARRAALLGRRVPRRRRRRSSPSACGCSRRWPSPLAAAHAEIAPEEAAAGAADAALRDERAGTPRGVAAGRARPAPGRDGRQGGLERLDARRAAS